jgi:hypothetical protein
VLFGSQSGKRHLQSQDLSGSPLCLEQETKTESLGEMDWTLSMVTTVLMQMAVYDWIGSGCVLRNKIREETIIMQPGPSGSPHYLEHDAFGLIERDNWEWLLPCFCGLPCF